LSSEGRNDEKTPPRHKALNSVLERASKGAHRYAVSLAACNGSSRPYNPENQNSPMEHITGIGGIFFKSQDPQRLAAWYREHLGVLSVDGHADFEWREKDRPEQIGQTIWSLFQETQIISVRDRRLSW